MGKFHSNSNAVFQQLWTGRQRIFKPGMVQQHALLRRGRPTDSGIHMVERRIWRCRHRPRVRSALNIPAPHHPSPPTDRPTESCGRPRTPRRRYCMPTMRRILRMNFTTALWRRVRVTNSAMETSTSPRPWQTERYTWARPMELVRLGCSVAPYAISSNSESFTSSAGGDSVNVTAPSGCSWSVINTSNFIVVTGGASGNGNGAVSFTIPADPGISRTGALVIAGHSFTVTQSGETTTAGLAFYPLTPCRIADTRVSSGFPSSFGAPYLSANTARVFPILISACNVPSTALAYSLNIGALPHQALGFLTVWPAGFPLPLVGTLGSPTGQPVANAALVPAGTNGAISLFANADTDVIIDIDGYFGPANQSVDLAFYTIAPCRVADTPTNSGFSGSFGAPSLSADVTRTIPVPTSACGLPRPAMAYSLNLDALPQARLWGS